MSRWKLSAQNGWWNRCGSFDDHQTNARCMGPEKPADATSKVLNSENFPHFAWMAPTSHPLIDILTCHDKTIHAITIIRLNLNPPFKNPRSATGAGLYDYTVILHHLSTSNGLLLITVCYAALTLRNSIWTPPLWLWFFFFFLHNIIIVLRFTVVAEFEQQRVQYCLVNVPTWLISCVV